MIFRTLAIFTFLTWGCFGGPYDESQSPDQTSADPSVNNTDHGVEAPKNGEGSGETEDQKVCSENGIAFGEECLDGIISIDSFGDSRIALRTNNNLVAFGRSDNMKNYDAVRNQLNTNTVPVKKIAGSTQGIAVLLRDGRIIAFGDFEDSILSSLHSQQNVVQLEAKNDGFSILVGSSPEDDCSGGCQLLSIGGSQPAATISNAATIFASSYSNVTVVRNTDNSITYFPNTSHALAAEDATGFVKVVFGYKGGIVGVREDLTGAIWGNNDQGDSSAITGALDNIAEVNFGEYHGQVIKTDGSIVAWGSTDYFAYDDAPEYYSFTSQSAQVVNITEVVSLSESSLARSDQGKLFFWGYVDSNERDILSIVGNNKIIDIAAFDERYIALTEGGEIFYTGDAMSPLDEGGPISDVVSMEAANDFVVLRLSNGKQRLVVPDDSNTYEKKLLSIAFAKFSGNESGLRDIFISEEENGAIFVSNDLNVYPIGEASDGLDPQYLDLSKPVEQFFFSGGGTRRYALTQGEKFYLNFSKYHSYFLPEINGSEVDEVLFTSNLLIYDTNDIATVIEHDTGAVVTHTNIDSVYQANYGYLLLQRQEGQADCTVGCSLIVEEPIQNQIDSYLNDGDPDNDIGVTNITQAFVSGNQIFLVYKDGTIIYFRDVGSGFEKIDPVALKGTTVARFVKNNYDLVGITTDNKIVSIGPTSSGGDPISNSSREYLPHLTLENVVDVIPTFGGFTALLSSNGNCDSGCQVTSWGNMGVPLDTSNPMGGAKDLTDIVSVAASSSAFLGVRSGGERVVWGSQYGGGDPTCSSSYSTCRTTNSMSIPPFIAQNSNLASLRSSGFWGYDGTNLDFWGSWRYGSIEDDRTIADLQFIIDNESILALFYGSENCSEGCQFINVLNRDLFENGSDPQGQVTSVKTTEYGVVMTKKDGTKAAIFDGLRADTILSIPDIDVLTPTKRQTSQ
ncbi:hypothetical protein [Pseudobacteriovorax antillogorgiicola]|uniref:Alpha-tubulin suppressor n=1 Tax=Pseudobacteriovorax antillogorgiicola TaxID=1513793 RepID=A0A1Y6BW99_9BACT|nr:hypothetical protein [Pseudobacteriovorax antillogorgiicola]TCS53184.1 hypothetical protein EDD56_108235 [Pseudobacteriovorax antillogorgiicola]SMF24508.1 hypothetical protein SAMN06296036_10811 [Pseudobacteriovorax antillogorgiicola]